MLCPALSCCWLFSPSHCPISCSPVFNEWRVEYPCQTTQKCATLQPASVSVTMFLFTSAANQGRGGPWAGGDLPGVRDGGAAQCGIHAHCHHVPQQPSKCPFPRLLQCAELLSEAFMRFATMYGNNPVSSLCPVELQYAA